MSERLSKLIDQALRTLDLLRQELRQAAAALRERDRTLQVKTKRAGRKPLAKREQTRRGVVLDEWRQAHKAKESDGLIHKTRKTFCRGWNERHGTHLTVRLLEKYQNWERMRRTRKA